MTQPTDVICRAEGPRWVCSVRVGDDPAATHHEVTVSRDLLGRMRPGAAEPDELIRDSFAFLLEREPRETILRSFDLPVIRRYFPEWEREIAR
jgi:hypothetical protein